MSSTDVNNRELRAEVERLRLEAEKAFLETQLHHNEQLKHDIRNMWLTVIGAAVGTLAILYFTVNFL